MTQRSESGGPGFCPSTSRRFGGSGSGRDSTCGLEPLLLHQPPPVLDSLQSTRGFGTLEPDKTRFQKSSYTSQGSALHLKPSSGLDACLAPIPSLVPKFDSVSVPMQHRRVEAGLNEALERVLAARRFKGEDQTPKEPTRARRPVQESTPALDHDSSTWLGVQAALDRIALRRSKGDLEIQN